MFWQTWAVSYSLPPSGQRAAPNDRRCSWILAKLTTNNSKLGVRQVRASVNRDTWIQVSFFTYPYDVLKTYHWATQTSIIIIVISTVITASLTTSAKHSSNHRFFGLLFTSLSEGILLTEIFSALIKVFIQSASHGWSIKRIRITHLSISYSARVYSCQLDSAVFNILLFISFACLSTTQLLAQFEELLDHSAVIWQYASIERSIAVRRWPTPFGFCWFRAEFLSLFPSATRSSTYFICRDVMLKVLK